MAGTPKSTILGPGTLKFGESGVNDFTCQVTNVEITTDVDRDDPIPTLCGGALVGSASYTAQLEVTFIQDLGENGIVHWSWQNKDTSQKVEFVPNTAGKAKLTGEIVVDPLSIGGEVNKRNTSDVQWAFVGFPNLDFTNEVG